MKRKFKSLAEWRGQEAQLWRDDWLKRQTEQLNARFEDRLGHAVMVRDEIRRGIRQSDEQIEVSLYAWMRRFLSKIGRYSRLEDVLIGDVKGAFVFDLLAEVCYFEPYLTAAEFWQRYRAKGGDAGAYQTYLFDAPADRQAWLVRQGVKTALATPEPLYAARAQAPPQIGDVKLLCYQSGRIACATRTTALDVVPFKDVPRHHANAEADGDGSLAYWKMTRQLFFKRAMQGVQLTFAETTPIILERFVVIATPFDLVYNLIFDS